MSRSPSGQPQLYHFIYLLVLYYKMWMVYDNLSSQQHEDSRLDDCVPSGEWLTSTCSFQFQLDKYLSQNNEFQSWTDEFKFLPSFNI